MWTRERLKTEAKRILSINYWLPLLVSFVATLLGVGGGGGGGGAAGGSAGQNISQVQNGASPGFETFESFGSSVSNGIERFFESFTSSFASFGSALLVTIVAVLVFLLIFCAAFAFTAFITSPVEVGQNRFYMENRAYPSTFSRLFWAFGCGNYMNVVKIMFFRDIKVFLWSLLFIVPGIIKAYEYYMVPYILAENPGISSERAFELSKKMTDGEKWNIFVLGLSFLGWYLLGVLACCVGTYFVLPYQYATFAELYQVMREKAYGMSFADVADLPGFLPQQ